MDPTIRPLGDTALSVDFGDILHVDIVRRVLALDAKVAECGLPGVVETVPTYRALTLHLAPGTADVAAIAREILALARKTKASTGIGRIWTVPVLYGGPDGCDLEFVAAGAGLSPESCVEAHTAATYTVAMLGFLPGFSYLVGLDGRLATPRRVQPRPQVPSSSISIGGAQTAIGSVPGPSGWHLIGRTPVRPFQPGRQPVFLFEPGDRVRFRPVSEAEAAALSQRAAAGALVAECA